MTAPLSQPAVLRRAAGWRPAALLAGSAVACAVALVVGLLLARHVRWLATLDRQLNQAWVDGALHHALWATVVRAVTFWGNTPVVLALTVGFAGWQVWRRRPVLAWWVGLTVLFGWLLNHLVKGVVDRARPPTDGLLMHALGSSFPSGHAQVGGYGWGVAGLSALLLLSGPKRSVVAAACWLLGLLIAASRVVLGVHWPTDVVVGWALGMGWALLSAACLVAWARRSVTAAAAPSAW